MAIALEKGNTTLKNGSMGSKRHFGVYEGNMAERRAKNALNGH